MTEQERDALLLDLQKGQERLTKGQGAIAKMLLTQAEVNRNIEKHMRRLSGDPGLYIVPRREASG